MPKSSAEALSAINKMVWDHARLQREVIAAARPFANDDMDRSNEKAALSLLRKAAMDLIEFEASHPELNK